MIYQSGIVSEIRGKTARVEFVRSGVCRGCTGDQGCGLGPLLAIFSRSRLPALEVDLAVNQPEVRIGDTVRIAIAGPQLLKVVSLAYLVPLSSLFLGAWLATLAFPQAGDAGALFGAVIGVVCASQLLARNKMARLGRYLRSARLELITPVGSGTR